MTYAILYNPGHNRVYFTTALKLSLAEFSIVAGSLSVECDHVQRQDIGGVPYLTFQTNGALSAWDARALFNLSFVYALFKVELVNGETYLKPVPKVEETFVDESMGTILKYTGKTNELFTRMMINVAVYSQGNRASVNLLDPIAGKGTTLYEGLIKGYNVYGIEIGENVVNESYHFVKRFLETAKYKFDMATIKVSGPNKSFSAVKHTFQTAKTKEDFKNKHTKTIEFIAGNTLYADRYYKKNYFDVIVGDLPYGVQHGNVTKEKQSSLTRDPSVLLKAALPGWTAVLKPQGVIVLAWNSNVLPREKMERLLEEAGLTVRREDAYLQFEHRVDQSILRDIVAAQKL